MFGKRLIAFCQAVLQVWVPAWLLSWSVPVPAWADRFLDNAHQGQSLGRSLVPNPSTLADRDESGNVNLHWKGRTSTVAPGQLFPDSQNMYDPHKDEAYGNHAAILDRTHSETQSLAGGVSYTAKAYQTLINAINRGRVNISHDPLWVLTDAAIEQALSGLDADCEIVTTTSTATTTAHVPALQTCERVYYPGGACRCYHDYTVTLVRQVGVTMGAYTDDNCDCVIHATDNSISCWGAHGCSGYTVLTPPVDYDEACPVVEEGVVRTVTASASNNYNAGVVYPPTCDNNLWTSMWVHNTAGSHAWEWRTASVVVNTYHIIDRGWTCDPGCEALLGNNAQGDAILRPARLCETQQVCENVFVGFDEGGNPIYEYQCHDEEVCQSPFTCTLGPCETATMISGAWVDQSLLYAPNPFAAGGISNLAREVTVQLAPFNQGAMNCWTDPQGETHCPENPGDQHDTCEELENNPNCSFVRQECIEGARAPETGICYAWDVVYDCGVNVGLDNVTTTMGYVCDGIIRCMGEECIEGLFDPANPNFARAAALLQVAQYAAGDMDCASGGAAGCRVWGGEHMTCKKALGGWVNCCQEPEGVSLVDYIKLLVSTYTMTSMEWNLEGLAPFSFGNPFQGTWADLSNYTDYLNSFWETLTKPFTAAWDSLTGGTTVSSSLGLPSMDMLTQRLMEGAYDVLSGISPDLAGLIFEEGPVTGTIQLTEGMMMVMEVVHFISWIFTIYTVLDILVHIIWACEQEEMELGAKKQLKVCHYVGAYCASDIIGICIEKRDSYCCYNSPLSRILQEQIRQQGVGGGWGSAKDPHCEGLLVSELSAVNWDAVDLSEWLALLAIGGEYPTQRAMTLDGFTGSGSQFNFNTGRLDAAQRLQERINQSGADLEQTRIEGGCIYGVREEATKKEVGRC